MDLGDIQRRFVRNAAMILGSRLIFGLVNLGTSAIVVRVFGLPELGVIVLLQAYSRLFTELAKFESWQAVLSYGAGSLETSPPKFRRLLGLTLGVDILSVLVGIIGAVAFIPSAASIFGWPPEVVAFAPVFVLSIPFITQATPSGVLRLVDRVDVLAWQHAANALVRLAGVLAVWALGLGLLGLVGAWFAGSVLSGLLQFILAFRELRKRGIRPCLRLNLAAAAREFPGIWGFLAFSNASSSVGVIYNSGAATVVGATLGPAAAATLQIAQQFASALGRPARLLGPIISPEFARLAASGDWKKFRKVVTSHLRVSALLLGALGSVVLLLLRPLLDAVYDGSVTDDIWLFRLLILNAILSMVTYSFEPALLSASKAGILLAIRLIAAAGFLMVVFAGLDRVGVVACGIGSLFAQLIYIVLILVIGGRLLRRRLLP